MNTPSFHQETCQHEVAIFQSVNSISPGGMSCVAAEVREARPWAALSLTALPRGGRARRGGWQACRHPVRPSVSTSLLRTRGLVTSACLPACPPHADCPRDLLAWKENTGCCGQANTAAVCPGIGAPVWRELADRTFCHLPALFQNSLALAGLAARGGGGLGAKNRAEESRALGPAG